MPMRLARPCRHPGCPKLDCEEHSRRGLDQRQSAAKRGYGRRWQQLRLMYLRTKPICEVAGCDQPATDVDHITPKRDGGQDVWDNLQALCHSHHSKKTMKEYHHGYHANH